jgi:hypothetical protein
MEVNIFSVSKNGRLIIKGFPNCDYFQEIMRFDLRIVTEVPYVRTENILNLHSL